MKRKTKIGFLSAMVLIIIIIIGRQSIKFYRGIREVKLPNRESRRLGNLSVYKWITVKKLAEKYKVSEKKIFDFLRIAPEKGDENIPLVELKKKYKKTPDDMKKGLEKIVGKIMNNEGKRL